MILIKSVLTVALCLLCSATVISQNYVQLNYNSVRSNEGFAFGFEHDIRREKSSVYYGLKTNLLHNLFHETDLRSEIYIKAFYPEKLYEFIGSQISLNMRVFKTLRVRNDFSVDFQFFYCRIKREFLSTTIRDTSYRGSNQLGVLSYSEYGPFGVFETNFCWRLLVPFNERFSFVSKIGGGFMHILGRDRSGPYILVGKIDDWVEWEFNSLINVGLAYRLKRIEN
jgi:hypothetical protein